MSTTEVVGYVASALVVLSLAMTSVVRLRLISLVGSVVFVVYAVLIGSVPIVITNVAIAGLNLWFLRNELGGRRDLGAIPVPVDSPYLSDFLRFHLADIRRFQPDFEVPEPADDVVALLLIARRPARRRVDRPSGRHRPARAARPRHQAVPRQPDLDVAVRQGLGRVPQARRRPPRHRSRHRCAPPLPRACGLRASTPTATSSTSPDERCQGQRRRHDTACSSSRNTSVSESSSAPRSWNWGCSVSESETDSPQKGLWNGSAPEPADRPPGLGGVGGGA